MLYIYESIGLCYGCHLRQTKKAFFNTRPCITYSMGKVCSRLCYWPKDMTRAHGNYISVSLQSFVGIEKQLEMQCTESKHLFKTD